MPAGREGRRASWLGRRLEPGPRRGKGLDFYRAMDKLIRMDNAEAYESRRIAEEAHATAAECHAALFGSRNGGATPEGVSASLSVRMARLETHVDEIRAELGSVRRVSAQLQAAGALVGAAVVGLQLVTLAMKLVSQ